MPETDHKQLQVKWRERLQEIRPLWNEWDPIGVCPAEGGPEDEYDTYLGPTLSLLEKRATIEEITAYLSDVVGRQMGLGMNFQDCIAFARKLQTWYSERWPESKT